MSSSSDAALPRFLTSTASSREFSRPVSVLKSSAIVACGVLLIAALAHVSLPWQPVPLTGQTFGVCLMALLYGRRLSAGTMLAYMAAGAAGLPVFAAGQSVLLGATSGYLVGMLLAATVIGTAADHGISKSFMRAFLTCVLGMAIVFACGLIALSAYVPRGSLLAAGLWPFVVGDLVKCALAALISTRIRLLLPSTRA